MFVGVQWAVGGKEAWTMGAHRSRPVEAGLTAFLAMGVGLLVFLSGVIGTVPADNRNASGAQAPAVITLLHGIPGRAVDVAVGGTVLVAGFQPGETRDLSAFAGRTLENVELRAPGTSTVVVGPVARLQVPSSGNVTIVAHARPDGTFTITPFVNQVTAPPTGQGRLTFRHLAAVAPVDLRSGSTTLARSVANPAEASTLLPAGELSRLSVSIGTNGSVIAIPELDLPAGGNLIVHAVGSVADDNFTILTQLIDTVGGAAATPTTQAGTPTTSASPTTTPAPITAPTLPSGPVTLPTVGTGATPTTVATGATPTTVGTGAVPVPVRVDTGVGDILPDRGEGYPVTRVVLVVGAVLVAFSLARVGRDLGPRFRR